MAKFLTVPDRFQPILDRALAAGLKAEVKTYEVDEDSEAQYLEIPIQAGRSNVLLNVQADELDDLARTPFEEIRFVDGYNAVYSPTHGWVEVLVENAGRTPLFLAFRRLHRLAGTLRDRSLASDTPEQFGPIEVTEPESSVSLKLGVVSEETRILLDLSELSVRGLRPQRSLSLRLEGLQIERHDHAVRAIKRLANAFLFQVELLTDIAFYIPPRQDIRRVRSVSTPREPITFSFP